MAGRYHDGSGCLSGRNHVAYDGRWGRLRTEIDLDVVASYDLSGGGGKVFGGEARIVTYYQPPLAQSGCLDIIRYALSADANVVESEIIRDNASPAYCEY